ncbi:TPA: hypothetical protein DCY43_01130 [candidate division WWE3 bacterium]|uniref:Aldehyde ferredoxin oxidoreductase N-terminal domain-containing protein n=3 Tax=Katanobacteria TaxID=422282 RepID=A0A0G1NLS0_UNCKA|nr:MAG: hypothetical protein UW82_C0002G0009 [candidate division WWE3 bacterium GW2011_GWC2_44_9]HAZ29345.1 hypothetical protein [candidate division WWE3 bacterium]
MEPKRVLYINLSSKSSSIQYMPELVDYVGGVTMGVKLFALYKDVDPVVLSIGPLNGYFPFVSKTCFVAENEGVIEDLYIGGSLGFRLRFSGLDAIVLAGSSSEAVLLDILDGKVTFMDETADSSALGLPGKRSVLALSRGGLILDSYFEFPSGILEKKFIAKKLLGAVITGTKTFSIADIGKYTELFNQIMGEKDRIKVAPGSHPSCSGCPMGCTLSVNGEIGGNILVHSLVACGFAEDIYSNLGTVFACLSFLGYKYTHEQLETLADLFSRTLKEIA